MLEEWRNIPGFPGYLASTLGHIRTQAGRLLTQSDFRGYRRVYVRVDDKKICVFVHKLVLLAFVGPARQGQQAAHYNGVRDDNRPENLRWATRKENAEDKERHGRAPHGETCATSKLTESQVREIKLSLGVVSYRLLAKQYGVSKRAIAMIRHGKTWAHLSQDEAA